MFSRSSNMTGVVRYCPLPGWVVYQRWRPATGSGYRITYISACMHDSNEIPTAIPMFKRSSNMTGLRYFNPLPVTDRHLWFLIHLDVWQYCDLSHHVVRPGKMYGFRWNFTCILSVISGTSMSWKANERGNYAQQSTILVNLTLFFKSGKEGSGAKESPVAYQRPWRWRRTSISFIHTRRRQGRYVGYARVWWSTIADDRRENLECQISVDPAFIFFTTVNDTANIYSAFYTLYRIYTTRSTFSWWIFMISVVSADRRRSFAPLIRSAFSSASFPKISIYTRGRSHTVIVRACAVVLIDSSYDADDVNTRSWGDVT